MNNKQGFPVFNTMIIANHITRKDQLESDELTDEDIKGRSWLQANMLLRNTTPIDLFSNSGVGQGP